MIFTQKPSVVIEPSFQQRLLDQKPVGGSRAALSDEADEMIPDHATPDDDESDVSAGAVFRPKPLGDEDEFEPIPDLEANASQDTKAPSSDLPIKLGTAVVSYGVVMPVISASKTCVTRSVCGSFLGPLNQQGVFVYGGAMNSIASNSYYAFMGAPATWRFFREQGKLMKLGVVMFVGSQCLQEYFISEGTGSAEWATVLAVLGAIPGGMFAFKHFAESHFGADWFRQKMYEIRLAVKPTAWLTEFEKKLQYYASQQASFIARLTANYHALLDRLDTPAFPSVIPLTKTAKMRLLLRTLPESAFNPPKTARVVAGKVFDTTTASFGMMGVIPSLQNTYKFLEPYFNWLPNGRWQTYLAPPLKGLVTGALGIKQLFSTLFFMGNIVIKKPAHALAWRFHRKMTLLVLAAIASWNAVSYASPSALFERTYNEADKKEVRPVVDSSAVVQHTLVALSLWGLLVKEFFAKDQREIFLRELEEEITRVKDMGYLPVEAYVKSEGSAYGLAVYPRVSAAIPAVVNAVSAASTAQIAPQTPEPLRAEAAAAPVMPPKKSCWERFSIFCCGERPVLDPDAVVVSQYENRM